MKRYSNMIITVAVTLGISGCSTVPVVPFDTDGSRSDGIVKMVAPVGTFDSAETMIVDWDAAEQSASRRCRQWGYSGVEAFSGITIECLETSCYSSTYYSSCGCSREQVTRNYQCID